MSFEARTPKSVAGFWGSMLDRDVTETDDGFLLPGSPTQVGLAFHRGSQNRLAQNRAHLHLTSTDAADQHRVVAQALDLGASHVDVGQRPEEGHIVLADPDGNEFCVIEPHNSYLAGTGFLGELACDGTREVGVFWSAALGWPLVWDQDEETAIQSPAGGTKVAWGGPPVAPRVGRSRQLFVLAAEGGEPGDLAAEVDHLVGLGARLLSVDQRGHGELADPDGNEFRLRPA